MEGKFGKKNKRDFATFKSTLIEEPNFTVQFENV